jgi:isocitrate/methylisocitrate lyase
MTAPATIPAPLRPPTAASSTTDPSPEASATTTAVDAIEADPFEAQVAAVQRWFDQPRFTGLVRLHSARDVAAQQGSIATGHTVARDAAEGLYARLRALHATGRQITTFGPYTPGQAVIQKRAGLEAIYLGGWATSAKGSQHEDPGPDLASYPLSAVPDEAASIVRALLTADRNQHFARSRMSAAERRANPAIDYRPFIIADADTGHGGDAHVRNLIRRFVEVGVPGYHIEDQRPGAKKCGHQDGKVLVAQAEQNKRLNAARLQLDIMRVPGIVVARTDAEAATLLDDATDERDQPFVLGATRLDVPSFRLGFIAVLHRLVALGVDQVRGHLLFDVPPGELELATAWLGRVGLLEELAAVVAQRAATARPDLDDLLEEVDGRLVDVWGSAAGLMTIGEALVAAIDERPASGDPVPGVEAIRARAGRMSFAEARSTAADLGFELIWDAERPRTPDGFYRVRGGIEYAIAKALAAAPFADLLWMETKTADLDDARRFADAIHAVHPDKMLAYNLSPSFNWDTTGMTDDEMRRFPDELGRLGFVFDFITYGGHQIDGLATEEFATSLRRDGMLALARLQRRLRLIESPYKGPQALVGGDRLDAALAAATGRTASTRAMGKRSTHHQHLVPIEAVPARLAGWLEAVEVPTSERAAAGLSVRHVPEAAGSDHLELQVIDDDGDRRLVVAYTSFVDARERQTMVVRRLQMTPSIPAAWPGLAIVYLLERGHASVVQFVAPDAPAIALAAGLERSGLFASTTAIDDAVIVAAVDANGLAAAVAAADAAQRAERRPEA